jgi:hypothetical protein
LVHILQLLRLVIHHLYRHQLMLLMKKLNYFQQYQQLLHLQL